MLNRDDIMVRRDELVARADELRERFADNVDDEALASAAALTLVSAGLAWGVTAWLRNRRSLLVLLLPGVMVAAGLALLSSGAWHRRGSRISEAEARVREELAALDPIARLQVMRDVAPSTVPFVRVTHN